MAAFSYNTAAELFPAAIRKKKRAGFAYRRFDTAAAAVQFRRAARRSIISARTRANWGRSSWKPPTRKCPSCESSCDLPW